MKFTKFDCKLSRLQKRKREYFEKMDEAITLARKEKKTHDEIACIQHEWSHEIKDIHETIVNMLSDRLLDDAETYDVALPERLYNVEEEPYWEEREYRDGWRLNDQGRELVRDKVARAQEISRANFTFYSGAIIGIGGLIVAGLAIVFK